MVRPLSLQASLLFLVSLAPALASAHIAMSEPAPRNNDSSGGKPCGVGAGDSFSESPMPHAAGSTVTLKWSEVIAHGDFRIAIASSDDGFAAPDGTLAGGMIIEDNIAGGQGNYEVEITLPNEICEACTIQVMQYGAGDYFQCADIVIEGGDGGGSGGATGSGGGDGVGGDSAGGGDGMNVGGTGGELSANAGGSGSGGDTLSAGGTDGLVTGTGAMDAVGAGGAAAGGAAVGGTPGAGGDGYGYNPESDDSSAEGGCAQSAPRGGSAWSWILMLGLAPLVRRRLARRTS